YGVSLAINILQGLRESVIPGTPESYVNIYTECWDGEPEKRPAMNKVVDILNDILTKTNILENNQMNEESNIKQPWYSSELAYNFILNKLNLIR
ncbi:8141_t:CDS:2, partial [Funneliformis geosporum]